MEFLPRDLLTAVEQAGDAAQCEYVNVDLMFQGIHQSLELRIKAQLQVGTVGMIHLIPGDSGNDCAGNKYDDGQDTQQAQQP